ncbi:isoprenylcysteine carboxylmethyltransferase family protein [Candidatus Bipolaricaulota bacterium]|nr:isoprenylcysteine carboxylmethyltransferase family protein [Candidatus Bipolaricaulota bacterium]
MNAFILVIPAVLIRYGLMGFLSKEALERAKFFPPVEGIEKFGYYVYWASMVGLLVYLLFLNIKLGSFFSYVGLAIYLLGTLLYGKSVVDFSRISEDGVARSGLYAFSRNPMYVGFFIYFLGCSILIGSWIYFLILLVSQLSVHLLILAEERWCKKQFGKEYRRYMEEVRRYI